MVVVVRNSRLNLKGRSRMVQSNAQIEANIASWLYLPNNESPSARVVAIMRAYIEQMRIVDEGEELVENYDTFIKRLQDLNETDFDLEAEVSFYQDMYDYFVFALQYCN